ISFKEKATFRQTAVFIGVAGVFKDEECIGAERATAASVNDGVRELLLSLPPEDELHFGVAASHFRYDVDRRNHELVIEKVNVLELVLAAALHGALVEEAMIEEHRNCRGPKIVDVLGKGQVDPLQVAVLKELCNPAMEAFRIAAG